METKNMSDTPFPMDPSELLGRGFGKILEVERFAKSIGYPRKEFSDLLERFGQRSGYDLGWL
jgi:hypothetical protein